MRSLVFLQLAFVGILSIDESSASGQDLAAPTVVALKQSSARLLRVHYPNAKLRVIVQSDDEPMGLLNRRALSMRKASYVFYRSDRISLKSQFFRERLATHGVGAVDLVGYPFEKRAARRPGLPHEFRMTFPRHVQGRRSESSTDRSLTMNVWH